MDGQVRYTFLKAAYDTPDRNKFLRFLPYLDWGTIFLTTKELQFLGRKQQFVIPYEQIMDMGMVPVKANLGLIDYMGIRYRLSDGAIAMVHFLGRKIPCTIWTMKRVTNELFMALNQCLAEYRGMSYGQPFPYYYGPAPYSGSNTQNDSGTGRDRGNNQ
jgi:hypothetical protein